MDNIKISQFGKQRIFWKFINFLINKLYVSYYVRTYPTNYEDSWLNTYHVNSLNSEVKPRFLQSAFWMSDALLNVETTPNFESYLVPVGTRIPVFDSR